MNNVKPGDLVVERNKTQVMTVVRYTDEHEWLCEWKDGKGVAQSGSFPDFALEQASSR